MGKIMAVDYGKKRCGIAVTDELQIIASGLQTVETVELFPFLTGYFAENRVEAIVVGLP
ncbi:MAG TPA: Holliday junction resolvase RuvX, partial [Chryseobacterium sp.]|nr:Holliday junction resolvase RuvX [Chryseobacterium sp.]